MRIAKSAVAGTLESSDAQVMVEPAEQLRVTIQSSVMNQYGRQIRRTVMETLARLEITQACVRVTDHGALDCTLAARVECAVFRGGALPEEKVPWGGMVR